MKAALMFPEITIAGTPYERGRMYGTAVPSRIRHSIASYARLFAYRRAFDWAASQAEALRFVPLLTEVAPDLLEEMRGLADGAGVALAEIVALNVRTELMAGIPIGYYHPDGAAAMARNRAAGVPEHPDEQPLNQGMVADAPELDRDAGECTTAAAYGPATTDGRMLLAQTWDWQGDQRAACVMLRVHAPGEPAILTMTEAGMLAKVGLNSAGLVVGLNLLRSQRDGQHVGMPVHILLRKMLQATTFADARALADRVPAGGSSCVTIATTTGQLVSLEISPTGVAEVWAEEGLLAHANHCVDQTAAAGECPLEATSTSRERQGRAWELLRMGYGALDVLTLQAILRDRHDAPRCICRLPDMRVPRLDRGESICGLVLDPHHGVIYVAPDAPCQAAFTPVTLA